MSNLHPTFALSIGSLQSSSDNPVGGPTTIVVERDMDIPTDAARLQLVERSGIAPGDAVTVELGYDGEQTLVFTGSVVALRPTMTGTTVLALGSLNALLNLRTAAVYEGQSVGSIARDLIDQAGLTAGTVDNGPDLPIYALDRHQSGFAHLKELADRLGYELYADRDGKVMLHALGAAANLDAGLAGGLAAGLGLGAGEGYVFGQHLLGAQANRREPAWNAVAVGGESPMSGQGDSTAHWLTTNDTDYRGAAGSGSPERLVLDPAARTKDLADRFAAGRLAVAARVMHQVQLTIMGRPQIELGDPITSSAVPDALVNGSGYVRAIRHRFGAATGFVTDVRMALDSSA